MKDTQEYKNLLMELEELIKETNKDNYVNLEEPHIRADEILCELLTKLGYEEVVRLYDGIRKWYA